MTFESWARICRSPSTATDADTGRHREPGRQRALGDFADMHVTDVYKHPSQAILVESCCGIGSLQTQSRH